MELSDVAPLDHDEPQEPVMLDLYAGTNAPLAQAFNWCGWKVVTPIDLERDPDLDISRASVRKAIYRLLSGVQFIACAMSCATKSRARERQPGPKPLRSEEFPRGLPDLSAQDSMRVDQDNLASHFGLALQAWGHDKGTACLRENPLRSLHWHDPVEQEINDAGGWFDLDYDACVFLGARKKAQRLRHNVTEFNQLPALRCQHVHDRREWNHSRDGYPTRSESEYTPSLVFTIAICVTAWAAKRNFLIQAVPRLPPICVSGDVRSLLELPPEALRQDMLPIMGFHLGLKPPGCHRDDIPMRVVAADVLSEQKALHASDVYIGPGHFSHRWPIGMWSNPFVPGRDGTLTSCVIQYAHWLKDQDHLMQALINLSGCRLICDCPANQLCHGDVLAALFWFACCRPSEGHAPTRSQLRQVALLASGSRLVQGIPLSFPQQTVVAAIVAMCPGVSWEGFRFPCIEDLMNNGEVLEFQNMVQASDTWDGFPAGPLLASSQVRHGLALASGHQPGAAASGKAMPPLISFGLGPDDHFKPALRQLAIGTPFEQLPLADDDLWFAARGASKPPSTRALRQRMLSWLQELGRRLQPVTDHVRKFQSPEVRSVTQSRHIILFGVIMLLMSWPDLGFVQCLLGGFPAVGFSPHVPVYQHQPAAWLSAQDILQDAMEDAKVLIAHLRPGEFDEAIRDAGLQDEAKGFCGEAWTWDQLVATGRPFRLIRRFCIRQPSGKLRVIDDAAAGGQSEMSADCNKLDLCSAIQPALSCQVLYSCAPEMLQTSALETGGEDWPDAYRFVPMKADESWLAIVAYWDGVSCQPMFRRYWGELFGLPNAVNSFNRMPRFYQAFCRRILRAPVAMYFDDLTIQDWATNRGSGQHVVVEAAKVFGSPFAESKHQAMAASGDFLGLCHDLSSAKDSGRIWFWPRQRLLDKVNDMIQEAFANKVLHPGTASKLFGCLTFLSHGCYGKVGRSGLSLLKERQYSHDHALTVELEVSLHRVSKLLQLAPKRPISLNPQQADKFLVASDAAQEEVLTGSAGAIFVDSQGHRVSLVMQVPDALFQLWNKDTAKIAQLELLIVLQVICLMADHIRGRNGLWYIDNVASLMSLIRGRSQSEELDTMAGAVHSILFALNSACYFEWIASKDNWSDGVSRDGHEDEWARNHCQHFVTFRPLLFLMILPQDVLCRVFLFV